MNTLGMWTLFKRETHRFLKVNMQTVAAPALTAILYLIVFRYAMGDRQVPGLGVDYFSFLIPGLAMMSMLQNAFANTSSSIIIGKVMNVHIYLLMAPLSALEMVLAFIAGAVLRAVIVASVFLAVLYPFVDLQLHHLGLVLVYGISGSIIMGGLGLIGGMWSDNFDHMSMVSNFIIMPLTFLSGVFYSIEQLPEFWQTLSRYNPFFYLIDGFRHGFLGVGDSDPWLSIGIVTGFALATVLLCWRLWHIGWRLKE